MKALCQEQATSGPAEVSLEQLEALPPPKTFRRMFSQVGVKGKGEERVSGEERTGSGRNPWEKRKRREERRTWFC